MIDSPCNDICSIDSKSGLCSGCGRTQDEIINWSNYSNKQKTIVLNKLRFRNSDGSNDQYMLNYKVMNTLINIAKKQVVPISLILILALARLIPHPPNFTPIIAVAIMSGFFFKNIYLSLGVLIISMLLADIFISFYNNLIFVYLSLLLITFIFYKLSKKINFKNLFFYSFVGSLIFFLISNFGVWALGSPGVSNIAYEKSLSGLIECYIFAIPFFGNTFLSTIIFSYPAIYIYKSLPTWSSTR